MTKDFMTKDVNAAVATTKTSLSTGAQLVSSAVSTINLLQLSLVAIWLQFSVPCA
jgi:hypothetical protein